MMISESDSNVPNGEIPNLLEQVENLSSNESSDSYNSDNSGNDNDMHEVPDPIQNNDNTDDLCVDIDNLAYMYDKNGDEMFDILQKDPEWLETFLPIYVNQFTQPTGPNLPEDFNTDTASPLEYFQLFFSNEVMETIVQSTN